MALLFRTARIARIVLIQIAIVLALLGLVEVAARYWEPSFKRPQVQLDLYLQPYVMFGGKRTRDMVWLNVFTKTQIRSGMVLNNYGYAEEFDFSAAPDPAYLRQHGKRPGERIVLITGGSVVHGVGATGNDKTIAAQMMRYLNERTQGTRYRVINMAIGSWIAYQQFLSLSLFGLPLDPDWIVVMDGHNDAVVPCAHGSGVANPLGWPKMLYLTYGGTGNRQGGPLLEYLAARSALVRLFTGINPGVDSASDLPAGLVYDRQDPDSRFLIKMENLTISAQDRQLEFYLQAQRNVLTLFHRANVILSSQPFMADNVISPAYRTTFDPRGTNEAGNLLVEHLDRYMAMSGAQACTNRRSAELLGYFMGRSALGLTALASAAQGADPSRRVIYLNAEAVFPAQPEARRPYFIDNAHLSDLGQEGIGEFFAEAILSADRGETFDYGAFVSKRPGAPAPRSGAPSGR